MSLQQKGPTFLQKVPRFFFSLQDFAAYIIFGQVFRYFFLYKGMIPDFFKSRYHTFLLF